MRSKWVLVTAIVAVLSLGTGYAQESARRPDWDQKKAVEKVKQILALEAKGELAWDRIGWQTDPDKAAAQAKKEQKPLFVFFFLKKDVGPSNAPC